jgi:hypothetical protein
MWEERTPTFVGLPGLAIFCCLKHHQDNSVFAPQSAHVQEVVWHIFATIFPMIPILQVAEFVHGFETFWRETESRRQHESEASSFVRVKPAFLCLLPAILFAGLIFGISCTYQKRLGRLEPNNAFSSRHVSSYYDMCKIDWNSPLSNFVFAGCIHHRQSQFIREEEFSDSLDL